MSNVSQILINWRNGSWVREEKEKSWGNDTTVRKEMQSGIFLVIDEFAALKLHWIRKNLRNQ